MASSRVRTRSPSALDARVRSHERLLPWLVVLGIIGCYSIPVGMIGNTAGIFVQPVMDEFGWDQTSTTLYRTIQPLVAAVCTPFAGRILAKYDARLILTISSILFGVASVGTAFATHLWQWNLYGVVYGVTCAFFMYMAAPLLVNRWFAKDTGKVLGTISAILSLTAAVFTPIAQQVINEAGWQTARLWLCGIATVLSVLLSMVFLRNDPRSIGVAPWGGTVPHQEAGSAAPSGETLPRGSTETDGSRGSDDSDDDVPATPVSTGEEAAEPQGAKPAQALRGSGLYMIMAITAFIVMTTAFFQQIPVYAARGPLGANAGAVAVSIVMVGGIVGKLFLGWISDRIGIRGAAQFSQWAGAVGVLLVYLAHDQVWMFYLGMGVYGFGYASLTVVVPLLVRHAFGMRSYATIYSWISTVIFLATSVSFVVYGRIADLTGSFTWSFYLVIGMYTAAALLVGPAIDSARANWSGAAVSELDMNET